ncbi:hypothetical protein EDS67_22095 [candidate division KSB1 bacterium]|nr:MAG: hypothetical protein EDS67_22095 [candidate division KSB1 bacterium]MBC6951221.1 hypothetical protein [candidate division KSB1 bacterium]MCE7944304.1 hypothetical protein [Chlorobi bacterium CHB1]MDL1878397.1 hypothetical protein [Cytophagia bacterium CHB2]
MKSNSKGYSAAEINWARKLYDDGVLPDDAPSFARKVLRVVNEIMPNPLPEHLLRGLAEPQLRSDEQIFSSARDQLMKIKQNLSPVGIRVSFDPLKNEIGEIEKSGIRKKGIVFREKRRDELLDELHLHLDGALRTLDAIIQHSKTEFGKLTEDLSHKIKVALARSVWELKRLVEREASRRKQKGLRVAQFRNEWKVVSELFVSLYSDKLEKCAESLPYYVKQFHPALEVIRSQYLRRDPGTLRRFAYRYGKKSRNKRMSEHKQKKR